MHALFLPWARWEPPSLPGRRVWKAQARELFIKTSNSCLPQAHNQAAGEGMKQSSGNTSSSPSGPPHLSDGPYAEGRGEKERWWQLRGFQSSWHNLARSLRPAASSGWSILRARREGKRVAS